MSDRGPLKVECPMPDCDYVAPFADFHDAPNSGCSECGADLETLQEAARDNDDAE